ncbi:hypothetical protein LAZ67_12001896 [Cordylochernes scorpioides]|uniref:Uncharacterized protein n=1 Tax=Cordylochernes scorpioides TaxID=51811 RepID=A0ABY6L460_9ARAC|nr:hypothetical protein LAZ67_12001896 [Cordylochernes scorpioides]
MQDAELSSVNPQLSPGPGATVDTLVKRLTEALQEVTASRAYVPPMEPYDGTYLAENFFRQLKAVQDDIGARYLYRDNWWRSWNIPSTPKPLEEAEDYKD